MEKDIREEKDPNGAGKVGYSMEMENILNGSVWSTNLAKYSTKINS